MGGITILGEGGCSFELDYFRIILPSASADASADESADKFADSFDQGSLLS